MTQAIVLLNSAYSVRYSGQSK